MGRGRHVSTSSYVLDVSCSMVEEQRQVHHHAWVGGRRGKGEREIETMKMSTILQ